MTFGYTKPADVVTILTNPFLPGSTTAGSGALNYAGTGPTDIFACRNCSYTSATDLASGLRGQEFTRVDNTPSAVWPGTLTTYSNALWNHGTNTGLRGRIAAAQTAANTALSAAYTTSNFLTFLNDVAGFIDQFPGVLTSQVTVKPLVQKQWAIAYKPIQTRFQTNNSTTTFSYQPVVLRESRFRGARSYCAMRQTAAQGYTNKTSLMNDNPMGSWWLWDYGVSKSTIKVAPPTKVTPASTGANAYVIPLAVGAKVTPLRGPLLPELPEFVHPLVWVTGDSEVFSEQGANDYLNSQHADLWTGKYLDVDTTPGVGDGKSISFEDIVLFRWGPVSVDTSGFIAMTMGKPVDGRCGTLPNKSDLGDGRSAYVDAGFSPPYSCTNVPGFLGRSSTWDPGTPSRPSVYASDAPLAMVAGSFNLLPRENDSPSGANYAPWAAPLPALWGMSGRFVMNDDRSVVIMDKVQEHLDLEVNVGLVFGPVDIGFSGLSAIDNTTIQLTTVREHTSLVKGTNTKPFAYTAPTNPSGNAILPQTNLVATAETRNIPNFQAFTVSANFAMEFDLSPFGTIDIDWHSKFFELGGLTTTQNKQSTEANRLRVGEYSDWGNDFTSEGTTGRQVASHVPSLTDPIPAASWFASYPNGAGQARDVPTCLADATVLGNPPPPELGDDGEQQTGEMCWYGPAAPCGTDECGTSEDTCDWNKWTLPGNACNGPVQTAYINSLPDQPTKDCMAAVLSYLCGGTHFQGNWGSEGSVLSRVYNDATDKPAVNNVYQVCVIDYLNAYGAGDAGEAKCVGSIMGQVMKPHACTSAATLSGVPPS